MITCEQFLELVDKYIVDGELNIMTRIEVRTHLDCCEDCRKIYVVKRSDKEIEERGY